MSGKAIPIIIGIFIIMGVPICAEARLLLTDEERNYIAEAGVLKAVSINGVAPIQYTDTRGEIQGISKRVLEEISDMTGLIFSISYMIPTGKPMLILIMIYSSGFHIIMRLMEWSYRNRF